ncbi:ATP-binding protein [Sunxiuqinia sp. A32]|uniref:ATP-binding protein n=1 Tax=Sunxiuqinia sp. A32 TaxID=3461496 RepID=UPI0040467896
MDQYNWLNEHKDNLKYAPNPSWPPGDFIDDDGIHKGIVADYIKIFEEELDVKFKRVFYKNWNEIYTGLLDGEVDFVGAMQATEERYEHFVFTDVFLKVPLVILVRDDFADNLSTEEILQMKLASVKGYITQDYVKNTFHKNNITEYDDDLTALIQTSLGNSDGTIIDLMSASYLVQKYGISNLSIGKELDFIWHLSFAFRKEYAELAQIINSVLSTISEDEKQKIFNKWVNINRIAAPNFFKKYTKYILILAVVFATILLLFYNYTIILKKQVKKRTEELNKELNEKKIAISLSKKNEARLESLFEISRRTTNTIEELLNYTLDEAVKLTESKLVILFKYDVESESFNLLSHRMHDNDKQLEWAVNNSYKLDDLGICSDIIIKKQAFQIDNCLQCISEDYTNCPFSRFKLSHTLIIPVKDDEQLEALLFLANKETEYDPGDAKQLVLLMSSVWKLLNKQKWQEELIIAKAKAEESDKLKSSFLANLSHEIRTPMNGILGFTELLKEPELSSEQRDSYIKIIHKSSHYLLSVIKDIIEISKIDSGLIKPNFTKFKVKELITDIYENIVITLPNDKNIKLDIIPSDINSDTTIKTDETKLRQIIENLISNAIKFTEQGTVGISYSIINQKELLFHVTDTGIGIDKKYHRVIFDRFRQGEKTISIKKGGSGLGLAISKAYIEMLGGEIKLVSKLGIGSTFSFSIPIEVL